jgi:hypothetical protein
MSSNRKIPEGLTFDVGRADQGQSFVRVTDPETGRRRVQFGLRGEDRYDIAVRLYRELMAELDAEKAGGDGFSAK